MEILKVYGPFIGLFAFLIGIIIATRVELAKRPTYKDMRKDCRQTEVCNTTHKSVDEKLACLPHIQETVTKIETKIDIFLEKNGK